MANLILIGPPGVGKSTVADWVTELTGRQRVSLDDRGHALHATRLPGYHTSALDPRKVPFMTAYKSWKPFELASVEKHLKAVDNHVIDFGAGHSVYDDSTQFRRAAAALQGHHVALLLPDLDIERSRAILSELRPRQDPEWLKFIDHVLDNPSNAQLANVIVARDAKTAKEVASEVLAQFPAWSAFA